MFDTPLIVQIKQVVHGLAGEVHDGHQTAAKTCMTQSLKMIMDEQNKDKLGTRQLNSMQTQGLFLCIQLNPF